MASKTFSTAVILRTMIPGAEEVCNKNGTELTAELLGWTFDDIICDCKIVGTDGSDNIEQLIFEYEGHHWSCEFKTNDGAGYNDFFGIKSPSDKPPFTKADDGSWTFNEDNVEETLFVCKEVRQVAKAALVWEEV